MSEEQEHPYRKAVSIDDLAERLEKLEKRMDKIEAWAKNVYRWAKDISKTLGFVPW